MNPNPATTAPLTTGLEDITRSLRALLRTGRVLGEGSLDLVEREVALAIQLSEDIRDQTIDKARLDEARADKLMSTLRRDTHRAVDLFADATSLIYVNGRRFLEAFADSRREPLSIESAPAVQRKN